MYLQKIGVDLESKSVIPFGFDWSCSSGPCSSKFKSLNNKATKDITENLIERLDELNLLNKPFSWQGKKMDSIGLGISKTKLMYFNIEDFPIKGIMCSTNDVGIPKEGIINLDCYTVARGNKHFDGALYSNFKAYCPAFCAKVE